MKKRLFKIIIGLGAPFLAALLFFMAYIHTPVTPKEPQITIEKGMSLKQISHALEENGIIRFPLLFMIYVQMAREGDSLQAGLYLFDKPAAPREVLNRLAKGLIYALKVRLGEGWTAKQISDYLETLSFNTDPGFQQTFIKLVKDPMLIQILGLNVKSLEGYLFPNTYYVETTATPADYLTAFVKLFEKNYQKALQGLPTLPPYSQHQIVTLASIIEKETGIEDERRIIASVFYNRLAKGIALQSDPTIIYGLKNFTGDIKKADIRNPHPYNTYVHSGLPPGPICNPGFASIKAALNPAQTNYLYFVSKGDGTHHFSATAKEHTEAVKFYQLP